MIVSKPKTTAVFSLTVFIIITLIVSYVGLNNVIETGVWRWYNYLSVYPFGILSIILSLRILFNYKIITFSKNGLEVWYPFRFKRKKRAIDDIEKWKEERVKTGKSFFRQTTIYFPRFKLKLSNQENSNYEKIFDYLNKRIRKKIVND